MELCQIEALLHELVFLKGDDKKRAHFPQLMADMCSNIN